MMLVIEFPLPLVREGQGEGISIGQLSNFVAHPAAWPSTLEGGKEFKWDRNGSVYQPAIQADNQFPSASASIDRYTW